MEDGGPGGYFNSSDAKSNPGYLFDAYKKTLTNPAFKKRLSHYNIDSLESSLFDPKTSVDPY